MISRELTEFKLTEKLFYSFEKTLGFSKLLFFINSH